MKRTARSFSVLCLLLALCLLLTTFAAAADNAKLHVVKAPDMAITLPSHVTAYYDEALKQFEGLDAPLTTEKYIMEWKFLAFDQNVYEDDDQKVFILKIAEMDLKDADPAKMNEIDEDDLLEFLNMLIGGLPQAENATEARLKGVNADFVALHTRVTGEDGEASTDMYITLYGDKIYYLNLLTLGYGSAEEQRELADQVMSSVIFDYSTYTPAGFADLKGHWAEKQVLEAVELGLFGGTGKNTFSPDMTMSRAMVVQTLYRMEGEPEVELTDKFTDVKSGDWYAKAVSWASENEIVLGSKGKFAPEGAVTREQLASILCRYETYRGGETDVSAETLDFKDSGKVSGWAADSMKWAVENGLITGLSGKRLAPQDATTRAQAAAILVRFLAMNN